MSYAKATPGAAIFASKGAGEAKGDATGPEDVPVAVAVPDHPSGGGGFDGVSKNASTGTGGGPVDRSVHAGARGRPTQKRSVSVVIWLTTLLLVCVDLWSDLALYQNILGKEEAFRASMGKLSASGAPYGPSNPATEALIMAYGNLTTAEQHTHCNITWSVEQAAAESGGEFAGLLDRLGHLQRSTISFFALGILSALLLLLCECLACVNTDKIMINHTRWGFFTTFLFHFLVDVPQGIIAIIYVLHVKGRRGVDCQICFLDRVELCDMDDDGNANTVYGVSAYLASIPAVQFCIMASLAVVLCHGAILSYQVLWMGRGDEGPRLVRCIANRTARLVAGAVLTGVFIFSYMLAAGAPLCGVVYFALIPEFQLVGFEAFLAFFIMGGAGIFCCCCGVFSFIAADSDDGGCLGFDGCGGDGGCGDCDCCCCCC